MVICMRTTGISSFFVEPTDAKEVAEALQIPYAEEEGLELHLAWATNELEVVDTSGKVLANMTPSDEQREVLQSHPLIDEWRYVSGESY